MQIIFYYEVGVSGIPKYGSESEFQKPKRAVPNYFRNSEKVDCDAINRDSTTGMYDVRPQYSDKKVTSKNDINSSQTSLTCTTLIVQSN